MGKMLAMRMSDSLEHFVNTVFNVTGATIHLSDAALLIAVIHAFESGSLEAMNVNHDTFRIAWDQDGEIIISKPEIK